MTNQILLAKGLDKKGNVIKVRGTIFFRRTGVADSIKKLQKEGLIPVPTYLIGEGRVAASRDAETRGDDVKFAPGKSVWNRWYGTFAETDILVDKKGILGIEGKLYAASFQNGGFFVHDPKRIRKSVRRDFSSIKLKQKKEVDVFLDAVKRNDPAVLTQKGWMKGRSLYAFNGFGEFAEESARDDFLADMPSYVVLRTVDSAKSDGKGYGYKRIEVQRYNEYLAIAFGGIEKLAAILDVAGKHEQEVYGCFDERNLHPSLHESMGFVTDVNPKYGINLYNLYNSGRVVGITPEELAKRSKIVSPLPLEVAVAQEKKYTWGQ